MSTYDIPWFSFQLHLYIRSMARSMLQTPQSPIDREGFLCPICVTDFGDSNSLARHFESAHGETDNRDGDVIDQVKGMLPFCHLHQELMVVVLFEIHDDLSRQKTVPQIVYP